MPPCLVCVGWDLCYAPRVKFRLQNTVIDLDLGEMGEETLTETEVGVLKELFEAEGSPVSRLQLYKNVWGYTRMPRGRAVDFTIFRLRKKLEACGGNPSLLRTVRGRGFRLIDACAESMASAGGSVAPASDPAEPPEATWAVQMDRPLDAFVGRKADLSELGEAVKSHSLVTVIGPPGVGKSRLVLEYLTQTDAPFLGISTTDLASEREVRARLGAALEVSLEGDAANVTEMIAESTPPILFIDDADFLAGQPIQAIPRWLRAAPDLRIIITSRRPLGVRGERLVRVAPLLESDGRALFLERAREVDFTVGPEALGAVDTLVESLDALPLAIELAASRLRVLDLDSLQAALGQRFRLLRRRGGSSSIESALASSWRTLSSDEQVAMVRLACLRGAFGIQEAAVLLDGLETFWLDVLESLVDHSLVQHIGEGDGVFRILWSISEFVDDRAELAHRVDARLRAATALSVRPWGAHRLPDLLTAARWPEAGEAGQACRSRALRVAIRTGRFAAARDALALGGVSTTPSDVQALSLLARLAAGAPFGPDATDATLNARVCDALSDTVVCLRWTSAERGAEAREQLADALEAACTAIEATDWAAALEAYEDGLDQEGQGCDFGLIPLQLVRMLALGRLGRSISARLADAEGIAREAHDTGMAAAALTAALLVARFHESFPSVAQASALSLARMGLSEAAWPAVEVAWGLSDAQPSRA